MRSTCLCVYMRALVGLRAQRTFRVADDHLVVGNAAQVTPLPRAKNANWSGSCS
jgi:hypothetical protein